MALSKNSKIEVADINAISSTASSALSIANTANTTATNAYNLANSKQDALGFTPIQQGGGIGQSTDKIYIGWNGSQLKCTVDQTDIGAFSFGSGEIATAIGNVATAYGSTVSNCTYSKSGDYGRVTLPSGGQWRYFAWGGSEVNGANTVAGGSTLTVAIVGTSSHNSKYTGGMIAIRVA